MPEPTDLMALIIKINVIDSCPIRKYMAKTKVETPVNRSEEMINNFLLYLSAHTPANKDITICGKNEARIETVIRLADPVLSVIYQTTAYETTDEPNKDNIWLDKNIMAFVFQLSCISSPKVVIYIHISEPTRR